jgi:hypothetical protein
MQKTGSGCLSTLDPLDTPDGLCRDTDEGDCYTRNKRSYAYAGHSSEIRNVSKEIFLHACPGERERQDGAQYFGFPQRTPNMVAIRPATARNL